MSTKRKDWQSVADVPSVAETDIDLTKHMTAPQIQLELYHYCNLCGAQLFFTHVTDYASSMVSEGSHCPTCQTKNKEKAHSLQ